jgi:hypothetical protein
VRGRLTSTLTQHTIEFEPVHQSNSIENKKIQSTDNNQGIRITQAELKKHSGEIPKKKFLHAIEGRH